MDTKLRHLAFFLLLELMTPAIRAQQSPPNIDQTAAYQVSKPSLKWTADGVRACSGEFFRSLPDGVYRIGRGVLAPTPKYAPKAALSDAARKYVIEQHIENFEAVSLVGLTIDVNGKPQDICVVKEAGHGLDRKAFEGVAKYRFEPASLNGKPVPVRITVEVRFAAY
jgi:TonB family protein